MLRWFRSAAAKPAAGDLEGNAAEDYVLKGKIQAARPPSTNRMQSVLNVAPVHSEIS